MRQKIIGCLVFIVVFLAGCTGEETEVVPNVPKVVGTTAGMEKKPVIEYEVPDCGPGILVNQAGYETENRKIAIFRGENLPDTFRVHDAGSGNVVFEGNLEKKGNVEAGEQIGYADFTNIRIPGEYFIEAEILGHSFAFPIDDGIGGELLRQNLQNLYAGIPKKEILTEEQTEKLCKAVVNMLLAEEMYGEVFDDEMGITESGNEISDLLDVLLAQVTLLSGQKDRVLSSENWEMVSYYATAMAKFSYVYKDYDSAFAKSCLQLADAVWKYLTKNAEDAEGKYRFMAAADLYRASGRSTYHNYIKEYCRELELPVTESREDTYGAVTYLSTKQRVDVTLCSRFMKEIMNEAEVISERSQNSFYLVDTDAGQENNEEILWDTTLLTIVNHIIANHEYATVIENHLHYLLGRNAMAISYVDGVGERQYSLKEGQQSLLDGGFMESALLFMLGEISARG